MGGLREFAVWAAVVVAMGYSFRVLAGNPTAADDRTMERFGGGVLVWALVASGLIIVVARIVSGA